MHEEVGGQPWRLERRIDDISEKLRGLALTNYHVFVQSQQCSQVVATELKSLGTNVAAVEAHLPGLQTQCKHLDASVQGAAKNNAEIQYLLSHYAELMELLEIPQLIDGCIANDLIEDALEAIQFTKKLFDQSYSQQKTPRNVILVNLVTEVQDATTALRNKIVQKLREDLSLATCLHMVAYLRRVDGLWKILPVDYDQHLKVEFLACRDAWLTKTVHGIPTSDPYTYLMQVIDAKRTSWFDMITQYSAIFGHQETNGQVDAPLCAWAIRTVSELSVILDQVLPKLADFGAIANVMEQMLFFGGSLGRVGVDFRGIVLVQFQSHLVHRLTTQWTDVVDDFEVALGGAKQTSTTPIMISSFRNLTAPAAAAADGTAPPHSLMAFPILAQLTNGFLTSFNDLRLCALLSLQHRLSQHLQIAMVRVVEAIAKYCHQHGVVPKAAESTDAAAAKAPLEVQLYKLALVLYTDWIPFIVACFDKLFTRQPGLPTALDKDALTQLMREKQLLDPEETMAVHGNII
ncbi:Aste57867_11633 [Aphanomyces stellatus]|uniref:Conserved oligomeric Golgi complex subunit 8 n=1 Tax=Aphanomyces stellatus TaxID=120398 RepID=A0A485KTI2_9STRA|nr:hypothetical protein As57867_011590 [Aphanomyces stellatus]VFT88491.1 Aste57867_11633 [Aphanomyces stellatus]